MAPGSGKTILINHSLKRISMSTSTRCTPVLLKSTSSSTSGSSSSSLPVGLSSWRKCESRWLRSTSYNPRCCSWSQGHDWYFSFSSSTPHSRFPLTSAAYLLAYPVVWPWSSFPSGLNSGHNALPKSVPALVYLSSQLAKGVSWVAQVDQWCHTSSLPSQQNHSLSSPANQGQLAQPRLWLFSFIAGPNYKKPKISRQQA